MLISQIFYYTQDRKADFENLFITFFVEGNTFFQSFRNVPVSKHRWKIIPRGLQIEVLQSFSILILTWSCARVLLGSKFWIILAMPSVEKISNDKRLCIKYSSLLGSSLLLIIRQHWSAKKGLKSSAFFLKSVTKSFLRYSSGMIGIFYYSERFWVKTNMLWSFSEYFAIFPLL